MEKNINFLYFFSPNKLAWFSPKNESVTHNKAATGSMKSNIIAAQVVKTRNNVPIWSQIIDLFFALNTCKDKFNPNIDDIENVEARARITLSSP